jgi:hypothetical protein
LRQGEPARSRPASGPSSRSRGARTSQTLPIYHPLSFKQGGNREPANSRFCNNALGNPLPLRERVGASEASVRVRGSLCHANLPSPAGLTRGSILFVRTSLRRGWIAGSSPAMTSVIAACVCPSPGSPAFAGSPPSPRNGGERVQTEFAARAELRRADP